MQTSLKKRACLEPAAGTRRGFTLTELLVVIGITSVLMFLLFIPLSRVLDLSSRGQAQVLAQDSVRAALRRVNRDLSAAMEVFPPRDVQVWGFDTWVFPRNRPSPAPGSVPEPILIKNGLVAFRLPKHRFFCRATESDPRLEDHYVTPQDIDSVAPGRDPRFDDAIALDTCPRHPGAPVDLRPMQPLEPDERVTAYFVGLKDPSLRAPGLNSPMYQNLLIFKNTTAGFLNTYVMYRVEFDPKQPIYANFGWPDFFYDQRPVTDPISGITRPFHDWWKAATVTVMDNDASDVVRWVETGAVGKFIPHSLVGFAPTLFEEDVAQPNRAVGSYSFTGDAQPTDVAPLEYVGQHGNWVLTANLPAGFEADGTQPLPDNLAVSNVTTTGVEPGPRIQVLSYTVPKSPGTPSTLMTVFDSQNATLRKRLVGVDPITGKVTLGLPRLRTRPLNSVESAEAGRFNNPGQPRLVDDLYRENYSATIDLSRFTVLLADDLNTSGAPEGDQEIDINTGMPSSLGTARSRQLAIEATSTFQEDFTGVVPGSEVIRLMDVTGPVPQIEPLKRVGWTGLGRSDHPVAQADLEIDEYAIDYRTGVIYLSERRPGFWTGVGPGAGFGQHLLVKYDYQSNRSNDVVRVSYSTSQLLSVNLGIVQYTKRRSEILPFEVSQRVAVRNLRR
jgi:prepilin-type N-terminal cleavage/methylation domain-containing protein